METVSYKNLKFQVWDLGGQSSIRPYWRCYYANTDAIIYVVDSADRDRVSVSKEELISMLEVGFILKSGTIQGNICPFSSLLSLTFVSYLLFIWIGRGAKRRRAAGVCE